MSHGLVSVLSAQPPLESPGSELKAQSSKPSELRQTPTVASHELACSLVMDSVRVDDLMGEVERLADNRGIEDLEALAALAESFAARVPPVIEEDVSTIPARIVSMFEFILTRGQDPKVRVFTPSVETHGYEAIGSVVEVCTADSPFLLDSITNEIERHEVKVVGVVHPVLGVERDSDGHLQSIRHARHSMTRESV